MSSNQLSVVDVVISQGENRVVQVSSKGKKIQAQTRRHTIRNSNSLVRNLSQPITITFGNVRLSAEN
jgi:hypothetical protein